MISPLNLPREINDMAKQQKNEKLAFMMNGLTVTLLAVIALKECKSLFRSFFCDERGHSR